MYTPDHTWPPTGHRNIEEDDMGRTAANGQLSNMDALTDEETGTSTTLLESLDFEIPCTGSESCEQPATDYLTISCGHGWFTCGPHAATIKDGLEKLKAIAVLTHHHQCECIECGSPDPVVVSIVPIHAGNAPRE